MSIRDKVFVVLVMIAAAAISSFGSYVYSCQKPVVVTPAPQTERGYFGPANLDSQNYLINGDFNFFQRSNPSTGVIGPAGALYLNATDWACDRWFINIGNSTVNNNQTDMKTVRTSTSSFTNPSTTNALNITQITSTNTKAFCGQVVEHTFGLPLSVQNGGVVTFQASFLSNTTIPVRMAILEWTGTTDTLGISGRENIIQDFSHSNDSDVSVTGSGHFFSTNVVVHQDGGSTSISSAKTLSLTATVASSTNNIIVCFWTTGTVGNGNSLTVAEAGLYAGSQTTTRYWRPRHTALELCLCQRYFEKSYDIDIRPGDAISTGSIYSVALGSNDVSNGSLVVSFGFRTTKRVSPGISYWGASSAISRGDLIDTALSYTTSNSVVVSATTNIGQIEISGISNTAGLAAAWSADSEM